MYSLLWIFINMNQIWRTFWIYLIESKNPKNSLKWHYAIKIFIKFHWNLSSNVQRKTSISLRFFINLCMTGNIDMVNIVILKVKHDKSSNSLADFLCNNKLELSMNLHKWFVSGETCLSIRWYALSNTGNQLRIIRISDTHINHYDPWNKTDLCFCRPEL